MAQHHPPLCLDVPPGPNCREGEDERAISVHQLLPKLVLPQYAVGRHRSRHAARHILHRLAREAPRDGLVIPMDLGVRLLEQREPRLVGVLALGKVEGLRPGLVPLPVLARLLLRRVVPVAEKVKVGHAQIERVVDHGRNPLPVAVKHEAVHAHLLVPYHAHLVHQLPPVRDRRHRRQPPAVPILPLLDIRRREPVHRKLRRLKDPIQPVNRPRRIVLTAIPHGRPSKPRHLTPPRTASRPLSLRRRRLPHILPTNQPIQTILSPVRLDIKIRIRKLLISTIALADDAADLVAARARGDLVRLGGVARRVRAVAGQHGREEGGVEGARKDRCHLAGLLGEVAVPEVVDDFLGGFGVVLFGGGGGGGGRDVVGCCHGEGLGRGPR